MTEIIFNTESFNDEQRNKISEFLYVQLNELKQTIELATLELIIITEDFTEDVIKTQRRYNMREIGHTNRNDGIAVAKVLHTAIQDDLKQTIVIRDEIIEGLFFEEKSQDAFHLLHHELCHIHDNFYEHEMFTIEARSGRGHNLLQHILACNAEAIWAEYIAVKLSANSVKIIDSVEFITKTLYVEYLVELIHLCKKNIDTAIKEYRINGDIQKLFNFLQEETSLLFKIAATTQGYIDGLGMSKTKITETINDLIRDTYFFEAWEKQWKALRELFSIYPNWNNVYQLAELGEAIKICWHDLGIIPSYIEDADELYIDVPFEK